MENIPVKKKSYGKANRARGHKYEVALARFFRQWFPNVVTSRLGNRARDGEGIDLCHSDESKHGRFPFNVQAKAASRCPAIPEIFERIGKGGHGLLFWRHSERSEVKTTKKGKVLSQGLVMVPKGEYVIMDRGTFDVLFEAYCKSHNIQKSEALSNS